MVVWNAQRVFLFLCPPSPLQTNEVVLLPGSLGADRLHQRMSNISIPAPPCAGIWLCRSGVRVCGALGGCVSRRLADHSPLTTFSGRPKSRPELAPTWGVTGLCELQGSLSVQAFRLPAVVTVTYHPPLVRLGPPTPSINLPQDHSDHCHVVSCDGRHSHVVAFLLLLRLLLLLASLFLSSTPLSVVITHTRPLALPIGRQRSQ